MSNALPNPNDAYGLLSSQVHNQAFFGRLGQHGISPRTEKEAADLLKMAGQLREAGFDSHTEKAQAADADSPITKAAAQLDQILGNPQVQQNHDQAVKQACAQLASDPNIFNAVLSLKAAEAEQVAAQFDINQEQPQS
jgi:hypothetical protein